MDDPLPPLSARVSKHGRPLRCTTCGRCFGRPEHLRRHLRTHTKEKPYKCTVCADAAFTRQDLLVRHTRLNHSPPPVEQEQSGLPSPPEAALTSVYHPPLQPSSSPWEPEHVVPYRCDSLATNWHYGPNHGSVGSEDAFIDFTAFMDTVGLDFELDLAFPEPPDPDQAGIVAALNASPCFAPQSTEHGEVPDHTRGEDDFHELKPLTQPWKVSEAQRGQLHAALSHYSYLLPEFVLPSRLSLARYVAGFVEGYCHHHPFIHVPTLSLESHLSTPELILAIAAVGAQYRYETRTARTLYSFARSIVLDRSRRKCFSLASHDASYGQAHRAASYSGTIPTLLLLATYTTWQGNSQLIREALEYQSLLARYIREDGLYEQMEDDGDDWQTWARVESNRRAKLSSFCFLSLQSIAFGTPPIILGNEIHLRAPTSCAEWLAKGQEQWLKVRSKALSPVTIPEASAALFQTREPEDGQAELPVLSPFGNYILIHLLHQRLYYGQQLAPPTRGGGLDQRAVHDLEPALHLWKRQWQKAPESVLDLRSSRDSLSFASTALLGLAYVRLHFNIHTRAPFQSCDPELIAACALQASEPRRGAHLAAALLHSVHAISVPVQLGIDYLAKSQAFSWSVQHALCNFECAVFLSKWLRSLSNEPQLPLTDFEGKIVHWIGRVVREAECCLDTGAAPMAFAPENSAPEAISGQTITLYSKSLLRTWARLFDGCNSAWPYVRVIGASLRRYGEMAEAL